MCQDIDTGGVSPQMIVRAEQTPDTADTVPCNPRPGLNIFMNAAAWPQLAQVITSGGGWAGAGEWWRVEIMNGHNANQQRCTDQTASYQAPHLRAQPSNTNTLTDRADTRERRRR